jgi:PhnB protein
MFSAYPNFGGDCREAFTRYQEIFGGELQIVGMGDMPAADQAATPEGMEDLVMNAMLTCEHGVMMGSDAPPGTYEPGRAMYLSVTVPDAGEARRVWDALGEGADVEMDLDETFWSPAFGMLRDRFGVPWMVNTEAPQG